MRESRQSEVRGKQAKAQRLFGFRKGSAWGVLGDLQVTWECFRRDMGPGRNLKLVEEAGEGREERMWALKLQSTRDESGVT